MSERPEPVGEQPEPQHTPTPESLADSAIPATYRRAPRTERFILTGVGIGLAIGVALGLLLPAHSGIGRGTAGVLLGLAGALAGGLITGAQAVYIDYTASRSADRQRSTIEQAGPDEGEPDGAR